MLGNDDLEMGDSEGKRRREKYRAGSNDAGVTWPPRPCWSHRHRGLPQTETCVNTNQQPSHCLSRTTNLWFRFSKKSIFTNCVVGCLLSLCLADALDGHLWPTHVKVRYSVPLKTWWDKRFELKAITFSNRTTICSAATDVLRCLYLPNHHPVDQSMIISWHDILAEPKNQLFQKN